MRLICPNCEANYEVDDGVIPESGRDVQCSNCGQTWFQSGGAEEATPSAKDISLAAEDTETASTANDGDENLAPPGQASEMSPAPTPDAESETEPASGNDTEPDTDLGSEADAGPESGPESGPERQKLDSAVLDILREEASHEEDARQAEGGLETQSELGLEDGLPDAIAQTIAESEQENPQGPDSRSDLLPDIEEINSTLQGDAGTDTDAPDTDTPFARRSNFRRGFLMMIVLLVLAAAVYTWAQTISAQMPALEGILSGYVEWVDGLRLWLDHMMSSAVEAMSGLTETDGS